MSSGLAQDDLAAVLSAKRLPNALVVPKVESADDIHWVMVTVRQLLGKHTERQQHKSSRHEESGNGSSGGGLQQPIALVTMCESANALLNLRWVAAINCSNLSIHSKLVHTLPATDTESGVRSGRLQL